MKCTTMQIIDPTTKLPIQVTDLEKAIQQSEDAVAFHQEREALAAKGENVIRFAGMLEHWQDIHRQLLTLKNQQS